MANMEAEMTMHQKREWPSRLTMKSEPMPDDRRPKKEPREMMETCSSWRWATKSLLTDLSKCDQRA